MCFQTLMSLFALSEKTFVNDQEACLQVLRDWTSSDFNSFERISKFLFKQELDVDFRVGAHSMLKYFENHEWLQFEEQRYDQPIPMITRLKHKTMDLVATAVPPTGKKFELKPFPTTETLARLNALTS